MKVILGGSISSADKILAVRDELVKAGHQVEIPEGVKNEYLRGRTEVSISEKADDKIKNNLIRGYYEKIKNYDAFLAVNIEKKGIKGYIGGNTFIEMAFAHVLNKKLFCLNEVPEMSYTPEIIALQPIVLSGDLSKVK